MHRGTQTWISDPTTNPLQNNLWSNPNNWSGGFPPGSQATFSAPTATALSTVLDTGAVIMNRITVNGTNAGPVSITNGSGQTLTLAPGSAANPSADRQNWRQHPLILVPFSRLLRPILSFTA